MRPSADDAQAHTILTRRQSMGLLAATLMSGASGIAAAEARGQLNIGVHISLAPTWFDPSDTTSLITPYMLMYGIHDALMKPMREAVPGLSLAESYTESADGLTHEFVLRAGITFHNGDPVTADDAKFTYERYRGTSASLLREKIASVEAPDASRFIVRLKESWPDFLTYFTLATGVNWIVPRKYVEKVGDAGFRKAPIGAGPYKFVSYESGLELVLEAYEPYWRKSPSIKRIVMRVIPDEATRLIALKQGEIDFAYSIRGELAAEVRKTPGLKLEVAPDGATYWMCFPEQWDEASPWHDPRVRRAVSLGVDFTAINEALCLGLCTVTSNFIPRNFQFHLPAPLPVYDPAQAMKLLAQAGYPNGFDAGFYWCDSSYANLGEAAVNGLGAIGIKAQLRPLERAAFDKGFIDKRYKKGIIQASSAAFGNTATRLSIWAIKGGPYVYGSYPDIDALNPQQAAELDVTKRTALLHQMQKMIMDRHMFVPLWQLSFINVSGPRVAEAGIGRIATFVYTGPYEELALK